MGNRMLILLHFKLRFVVFIIILHSVGNSTDAAALGFPIREGGLQGIGQCLIREYRICCHVLKKEVSKDFFEGCRAILVDKDKSPKWEPSKLELVSEEMVDRYFTEVDEEGWEDLKLPVRHNLTPNKFAKL